MPCRSVVTGGTSGIGLLAAEALAESGCDLVISARSEGRLREVAGALSSKHRVHVHPIRADLSVREDVERLARESITALGGVDFAFMSYGNPPCEPCEPASASWDDWEYAFRMYVASSAIFASELVRSNSSKTTLVMVSSFSSRSPMWSTGVSDVIRASLPALAKLFSRRYADRIRAIVLEVGSFRTPGAERLISSLSGREGVSPEEFWQSRVASISPLRRLGRPEELKDIVKWLLRSPDYMTGVEILFDGGSLGCV